MAILTDDNYVDKAEKTIKNLVTDKRNFKNRNSDVLSMSKLRNLLSLLFASDKTLSSGQMAN